MKRISTLTILAAIVLALCGGSLLAQPFMPPIAKSGMEITYQDMQRAFQQWARGRDLSQTKGWKWYKRWEAYNETRLGGDGSLPDALDYWQAATRVAAARQTFSKRSSGSGWSPVGPVELPTATDPTIERGLGRINCVAFHPTDTNTLWVGVAQGGVWKTVNHGLSWAPLTDNLPLLRISDIAIDPQHPDTMYIAVGDYAYIGVDLVHAFQRKRNTHYGLGVFKTTDGGVSWNPTGLSFKLTDFDGSLIRRVFIHPFDPTYLLAAGSTGIWFSSNGGDTWESTRKDLIWDIEQDQSEPNTLYASTGYVHSLEIGSAGILKSIDFGQTWTVLNTGITPTGQVQRIELTVAPSDSKYIYGIACGLDGGFQGFYRSTDAGLTWQTMAETPNAPNILGWFTGKPDHGDYGGQGWYDLAILVDAKNREKIYIGGINIWVSENGGSTFAGASYWRNNFGKSVHADQHFFAYNPRNKRYYVCNDGGIYTTTDIRPGSWESALADADYAWPTVWENMSGGLAVTSFYRIGLSRDNPGTVIGGAQDNSCYYTDGKSSEWKNLFGGDGMDCFLHPSNPNIIYGSSQYGNLHKTTDGGKTVQWSLTQSVLGMADQGEWTTPFAMNPNDPSVIYAAMGNLWRNDGDDTTWVKVSEFEPIPNLEIPAPASAMAISAVNPDYIYLAKRVWHAYNVPSQMWVSSNGGSDWRDISAGLPDSLYLTSIALHDSDPNIAWVTCGGFINGVKIFHTTDVGTTWQNISSDLPNLPVNSVVYEPGSTVNRIYVGTDIGVYYTGDDVTGWQLFSQNLPNVIVSELEIHQSSRKLYAATFGRGVWVTDLAEEWINSVKSDKTKVEAIADVYPNPTDGIFTLNLKGIEGVRQVKLDVVDITGRLVHSQQVTTTGETLTQKLDLDLPYGVYFLRASWGKVTRVVRFMVEGSR